MIIDSKKSAKENLLTQLETINQYDLVDDMVEFDVPVVLEGVPGLNTTVVLRAKKEYDITGDVTIRYNRASFEKVMASATPFTITPAMSLQDVAIEIAKMVGINAAEVILEGMLPGEEGLGNGSFIDLVVKPDQYGQLIYRNEPVEFSVKWLDEEQPRSFGFSFNTTF